MKTDQGNDISIWQVLYLLIGMSFLFLFFMIAGAIWYIVKTIYVTIRNIPSYKRPIYIIAMIYIGFCYWVFK